MKKGFYWKSISKLNKNSIIVISIAIIFLIIIIGQVNATCTPPAGWGKTLGRFNEFLKEVGQ